MAVTKGVLDWILYEKYCSNNCRLIEFIKQIIQLILMDTLGCHRNKNIKGFITKSKNNFVYILPYHHYMNLVEKFFNQLKNYMKKEESMSYDLIKKSIKYIELKLIKITSKHL